MTKGTLRVLARNETGGPVLWSYTTADPWDCLFDPGRFNGVNNLSLRTGDLIFVDAGYPARIGILAVVSSSSVETWSNVVVAQVCAPVGP